MISGDVFCFNLSVIDDDIFEPTEQFELYFENLLTSVGDPSTLCITIEDRDGKLCGFASTFLARFTFSLVEFVIGFVEPSYTISESGGQQEVCAEIKSGNLQTRVTIAVQFSTANGVAIGKFYPFVPPTLAKICYMYYSLMCSAD